MREAMARLPPNQRDLIRAHYVRGESYGETGARLRISTSAVKSRLHRARKRLKEEMGNMNRGTSSRLGPAHVKSLALAERFRSTGEASPSGNRGVLLDRRGYAVATDGARLLMRRIAALEAFDTDVLVEPNGAEALTGSAELTVHLDEVRLALATDELAWGISPWRFPDYRRILPRDADVLMRIRVRASELRSATDGPRRAVEGDHVRLSLLPGGTLASRGRPRLRGRRSRPRDRAEPGRTALRGSRQGSCPRVLPPACAARSDFRARWCRDLVERDPSRPPRHERRRAQGSDHVREGR